MLTPSTVQRTHPVLLMFYANSQNVASLTFARMSEFPTGATMPVKLRLLTVF